jgi:hypothetical protein
MPPVFALGFVIRPVVDNLAVLVPLHMVGHGVRDGRDPQARRVPAVPAKEKVLGSPAVVATELGQRALEAVGYSGEDARITIDQLVDNSLCGYRFAGLPRVLAIATDVKTKQERKPVSIVRETPVSALIDGGNNIGYVAAYRGAEIAIQKAKTSGMATVGVFNSYYSGRNAYFVEKIVKEGLVAFHTSAASPRGVDVACALM